MENAGDDIDLRSGDPELSVFRALATAAPREKRSAIVFEPVERPLPSFVKTVAALPRGVHRVAATVGYFAGATFLCGPRTDDEGIFFAANRSDRDGAHRVHELVPRFSTLNAEGWPSIAAWLDSGDWDGGPFFGGACRLPHLDVVDDPAALSQRAQWLVCGLAGLDAGGDEFEDAPSVETFERETTAFDGRPHLAVYWLLHHFIAGNASALRETLDVTKGASDAWLREVRTLLEKSVASEKWPKIGHVDGAFAERFEEHAPAHAIE